MSGNKGSFSSPLLALSLMARNRVSAATKPLVECQRVYKGESGLINLPHRVSNENNSYISVMRRPWLFRLPLSDLHDLLLEPVLRVNSPGVFDLSESTYHSRKPSAA